MSQLPKDLFWNLLAKKLAGEATDAELQQLTELSRSHPDLVFAAQHLEDLWQLQPDFSDVNIHEAFEQHWNMLNKNEQETDDPEEKADSPATPHHRKMHRWFFTAGLLSLSALAIFLWWQHSSTAAESPVVQPVQEIVSRPGTRTKLLLPDSSVVWLNAGSRISYNQNEFGAKSRDVSLSGEAFFEVKKTGLPFIVKTGVVKIRVLGTAFNVRCYPGDKTTETSLIHGKVEITVDRRPEEIYVLKPNEKLTVKNDIEAEEKKSTPVQPFIVLSSLILTKDSLVPETSWVDNKLVFENESFAELAQRMERWYNVQIEFDEEELAQLRLTGVFEKETIQQALEALQYTAGFHFDIRQNTIHIRK